LTLGWTLVALFLAAPWLGLFPPAHALLMKLVRGGFLLVLFWAISRSIDVGQLVMAVSPWGRAHNAVRSLLPLFARVGKVIVWAVAFVAFLSELGYPVASLVAGLGIGGLAVALAAQKTVENLFGAFSIGADQPFREGDTVRVEDFVGTVEAIGLRSTRIRTPDRTLISIPNGKLADMRLESLSARDRLRFQTILGLVYGTSAAQLREVLAGVERVLRTQPKLWTPDLVVRFQSLGDSSLNVEIVAWFETTDWAEFLLVRQELLIAFMEVVEAAGSSLAFPTRTVHVVHDAAQASRRDSPAEL
jgi:MscS family membrane protein